MRNTKTSREKREQQTEVAGSGETARLNKKRAQVATYRSLEITEGGRTQLRGRSQKESRRAKDRYLVERTSNWVRPTDPN